MSNFKYTCPLCGAKFDATDVKCRSCPMAKSCNVTCCPNCGYGFTAESRLVEWLKRRFGSQKEKGDDTPKKGDAA